MSSPTGMSVGAAPPSAKLQQPRSPPALERPPRPLLGSRSSFDARELDPFEASVLREVEAQRKLGAAGDQSFLEWHKKAAARLGDDGFFDSDCSDCSPPQRGGRQPGVGLQLRVSPPDSHRSNLTGKPRGSDEAARSEIDQASICSALRDIALYSPTGGTLCGSVRPSSGCSASPEFPDGDTQRGDRTPIWPPLSPGQLSVPVGLSQEGETGAIPVPSYCPDGGTQESAARVPQNAQRFPDTSPTEEVPVRSRSGPTFIRVSRKRTSIS